MHYVLSRRWDTQAWNRLQTWESDTFERIRGGVRAVTRPAKNHQPITRMRFGFRFLIDYFRNNVFKPRRPIKSLKSPRLTLVT